MTDFDKWISSEPDERCDNCNKIILDEFVGDEDRGYIFCDERCKEEEASRRAERAYERSLDRYYGDDAPLTERERYEAAWRENKEVSR